MTDFTEGLRKLVEDTATRVAEGVLQRGLALVEDLQRRADALLRDSELGAERVKQWRPLLEAAAKAGQETFLSRAQAFRVGSFVADAEFTPNENACGDHVELVGWPCRATARLSPLAGTLPKGSYTVVVSFYRQGA